MEQILKAHKRAYSRTRSGILTYYFFVVCIVFLALFDWLKTRSTIEVFLAITIVIVVTFVVIYFVNVKGRFVNSKLFKNLVKLNCENDFLRSIDVQIQEHLRISYQSSLRPLNIFVTDQWFVFISARGSIIRKLNDISKIYGKFSHKRSRYILVVDFVDGSSFTNRSGADLEDILAIIENNYPQLVLRD